MLPYEYCSTAAEGASFMELVTPVITYFFRRVGVWEETNVFPS